MKKVALALWALVVLPFAVLLGLYMGRFPWPFIAGIRMTAVVDPIISFCRKLKIWHHRNLLESCLCGA